MDRCAHVDVIVAEGVEGLGSHDGKRHAAFRKLLEEIEHRLVRNREAHLVARFDGSARGSGRP